MDTVADVLKGMKVKPGVGEAPPRVPPTRRNLMFPKLAELEIQAAREEGFTVFRVGIAPTGRVKCSNCNDLGSLQFKVCRGPFQNIPNGKPMTWVDGAYWSIEKNLTYPCPACANSEQLRTYLWDDSGLEVVEQGWHIDYLEGMEGKKIALQAARSILEQAPKPAGWYLFYGDYGTGKSGILKSIVAAYCRVGVPSKYITAYNLLQTFKATYGDNNTSDLNETQILEMFGGARILAIDEVDRFTVSSSGWGEQTLAAILDARYNKRYQNCTILATNQDPANLWPYLENRSRDGIRVLVGGKVLRGS